MPEIHRHHSLNGRRCTSSRLFGSSARMAHDRRWAVSESFESAPSVLEGINAEQLRRPNVIRMESERFLAERQCLGGMCFSQITVENAKIVDSLADDAVWS